MDSFSKVFDRLNVVVLKSRQEMGFSAANYVSGLIEKQLAEKESINMIFAAAPSQNEFLKYLLDIKTIEWGRINGFHMDEYIGLPADSDNLFSKYLSEKLFSHIYLKNLFLIDSNNNPNDEIQRYSELIRNNPPDIVCMGIGENGHIAFNDPPVADFDDKEVVKIVELDQSCRQQQVNDGCFNNLKEVPTHAITLTIPALMSADHLSVVVPSVRKAEAVRNSLLGDISLKVPASILKTHSSARMFLDADSYSLIDRL